MGKLVKIDAKEARKITEESTFLLTQTYKWIRDAAKSNMYRTPFGVMDADPKIVEGIMNTLKNDGFTVTLKNDDGTVWYDISW